MLNTDLPLLISQLTKIKKKFDALHQLTTEYLSTQPYEAQEKIEDLNKELNSSLFINLLGATNLYQELKSFVNQMQQKINAAKDEFHFNLGRELKAQLQDFAELKGQLPLLKIKYYTLEFDFSNGQTTIWWGPQKEIIKKTALVITEIIQALKSIDQNLHKKWRNYQDFFRLLKLAYERYLKLNNLSFGEKINLLDILTEFVILIQSKSFKTDPSKSHFQEYSRIQYSYDLYCMKSNPELMTNIQLSVATFAITEDKTKSLWIPDNELGDGTYYQTIAFK